PVPSQFARALVGPGACDADSNVIVRPYEGGYLGGVTKLYDNGRKAVRFTAASAPGFEKRQLGAVAVAGNDLYFTAANGENQAHVLRLDNDGRFVTASKLEIDDVGAMQLAVFDNGDFLVSGRVIEKHQLTRPFIGIFNSRGQLQAVVNPK